MLNHVPQVNSFPCIGVLRALSSQSAPRKAVGSVLIQDERVKANSQPLSLKIIYWQPIFTAMAALRNLAKLRLNIWMKFAEETLYIASGPQLFSVLAGTL